MIHFTMCIHPTPETDQILFLASIIRGSHNETDTAGFRGFREILECKHF